MKVLIPGIAGSVARKIEKWLIKSLKEPLISLDIVKDHESVRPKGEQRMLDSVGNDQPQIAIQKIVYAIFGYEQIFDGQICFVPGKTHCAICRLTIND